MNRYDNYAPEITDPEQEPQVLSVGADSPDTAQSADSKQRRSRRQRKAKQPDADKKPGFFTRAKAWLTSGTVKGVVGVFAACFGVYLLVSFISFFSDGISDQSAVQNDPIGQAQAIGNLGGEGGARISQFLINDCFGVASAVVIFWLLAISLKLLVGKPRFKTVNFTIKCLVALITLSLVVGLLNVAIASPFNWGGNHGLYINKFIIHFVGWYGAALLCIFLIAVFFLICLNDLRLWILKKRRQRRDRIEAERQKAEEEEKRRLMAEQMSKLDEEQTAGQEEDEKTDDTDTSVTFDPESSSFTDYALDDIETDQPQTVGGLQQREASDSTETVVAAGGDSEPMKVKVNQIDSSDDAPQPDVIDPTAGLSHYKFPPYELLREAPARISVDHSEQIENQERIRKTLLDFKIPIVSIEATVGPTVTLYEIVPAEGIKISKIRSLADDIALSLAATGVRIIAPIPGKGTVGIEVANKEPQTVSMRTILTSKKYTESKYELPVAVGSTISNQVYITDLTKMPHLLVAGATGQGKSVGLNAIIASLLYRKHPAELKFVLIDPKMVEFSLYSTLERHYLAKLPDEEDAIITDPQKVVATLSSLCVEMDDRYALLKMAGKRNIKEYNEKYVSRTLNPEKGHRYLPYIVVIVDEFSDLIMTAGKEVETPIARIAQKARAVGIHMIIATQRPSTNVITGLIKANFPARMAFKVSSGVDSKTILDTPGAQHLIGRGDMLISQNSDMDRVQCAFIDTPEVEAICEFIGNQPGYGTAYMLPEPRLNEGSDGERDFTSLSDRDPLFEEVAREVVNSNSASTSSVQRRYRIGYNRAGSIMDQLEAAGIVGPATGGKPRDVLVDPMSLEQILSTLS